MKGFTLLAIGMLLVQVVLLAPSGSWALAADEDPFKRFTRRWRQDPIWRDGKAEMAVYNAIRTIYCKPRRYTARLYTNTEYASAVTKTKAADNKGRLVFKHHLRQDITTENYTYHYSTMCYLGVKDLKSLKLDMGSQEDCGASFKQFVNHAGICRWESFGYFPNEGHRSGSYQPPANYAFLNGLSLLLRGYPFDDPAPISVQLLPDQISNRQSTFEPVPSQVRYVGRVELELPIGKVDAHHLKVEADPSAPGSLIGEHDFWFAARGAADANGTGLHLMVQYEGPDGAVMKLRQVRHWKYWQHPP